MAYGLTPWDPFRELDRLERLMRRGFEGTFGRGTETLGAPAVEITDEGDHYLVRAEIPGVPEDAVEITLTGNVLTLRGEKRYEKKAPRLEGGEKPEQKQEKQEKQAQAGGEKQEQQAVAKREEGGLEASRPIFSEVFYGRFERVLTLPDDIDPEKVEAACENGVFSIEVGKKAQQRARRISVTRH